MKKICKLLLILAFFLATVNGVFAMENPFSGEEDKQPNLTDIQFNQPQSQPASQPLAVNNQPNLATTAPESPAGDFTVVNSSTFELNQSAGWDGKKFKAFDNKFVFQIDAETFKGAANLTLKEIMLTPGSKMTVPADKMLASLVYEYDLQAETDIKPEKNFWFSIKYSDNDYFRKNIYYFDENKNQWVGLPGIISNGASKIIANFPMRYAKLAILEEIGLMVEGTASWYKYKGCDCAASPDYPKGTKLVVTNLDNNKTVTVKVNDWGPDRSIHPDRVIDLDVVAFKKIASKSKGLCRVKVEPFDQVSAATKQ